jgi:hypothetical protein
MDMTHLVSAASIAAGKAPEHPAEYRAWRGRVLNVASDLATMVMGYEAREARKSGVGVEGEVRAFTAKLLKVETITKGSGTNQVAKGKLSLRGFKDDERDDPETIETAPLSTAEGAEEFARAQALVGQTVLVHKRNFPHPTDKEKKLKELVAIDPASGFVATPAAKDPEEPSSSSSGPDREVIRAELNSLAGDERLGFLQFLQEEGIPTKVDDMNTKQLVAVRKWLDS